jgi:antitoxin HicB
MGAGEMPRYPVRLIPGEDGLVLVTFPDVPEAVSCGAGEEEAIQKAEGVLQQVLDGYRSEGRPLPAPSDICGAPTVEPKRIVRW